MRNKFRDVVTYGALRVAAMFLHCWPVRFNLLLAGLAGDVYFYCIRRHRNRALFNLRNSFPNLSEQQRRTIARRSIRQMFMMGVEFLFTPRLIKVSTYHRYVRLRGFEQTLKLMLENERGMILLTGHYGNWEVLGYVLATLGFPTVSVARPLDNPHISKFVFGMRERVGQRIVAKKGATEEVVATLDAGGMVGFTADQNAGPKGIFVDFLGRKASTYKSIALLAMQYRVPVVIGYSRRVEGHYQFDCGTQDVIMPDDWRDEPDPMRYITKRYSDAIERIVLDDPNQYLWMHRRWKTRPKGEPADDCP